MPSNVRSKIEKKYSMNIKKKSFIAMTFGLRTGSKNIAETFNKHFFNITRGGDKFDSSLCPPKIY